jgi:hypothetical protein
MSDLIHTSSITLESVQQAFHEWRCSKPRKNVATPQHLWDMVRSLLTDIEPDVLRAALHLTRVQMHKYVLTASECGSTSLQTQDFVTIKTPVKTLSCDVVIQHAKGHEMRLKAEPAILQQVIATFVGYEL